MTSFRLRMGDIKTLKDKLPNIVSNNSHHLLARKICRDFVDGKLVYGNRRDMLSSRQGD